VRNTWNVFMRFLIWGPIQSARESRLSRAYAPPIQYHASGSDDNVECVYIVPMFRAICVSLRSAVLAPFVTQTLQGADAA
jgi:hypothetical protein